MNNRGGSPESQHTGSRPNRIPDTSPPHGNSENDTTSAADQVSARCNMHREYEARHRAREMMPSMPGWAVHWACSRLMSAYAVLAGNGNDLIAYLTTLPPLPLPVLPSPELRHEVAPIEREAFRRVHNYLSSSKTLVDHSRRIGDKQLDSHPDVYKKYKEKTKAEFADRPERAFVQDLRNAVIHVSPPNFTVHADLRTGAMSLTLSRQRALASYDNWRPAARIFLDNNQNDNIDIEILVKDYQSAALDITATLLGMIVEVHAVALAELYELRERISHDLESHSLTADDPIVRRFDTMQANAILLEAV